LGLAYFGLFWCCSAGLEISRAVTIWRWDQLQQVVVTVYFGLVVVERIMVCCFFWVLFFLGAVFLGANSCYYAGGDKAAPTVGHIASL